MAPNATMDYPTEKILLLEAQMNSLRNQVNVLTAEMDLTHGWICKKFGTQIVDLESMYYKSVHGSSFEMESIKKSLQFHKVVPGNMEEAVVPLPGLAHRDAPAPAGPSVQAAVNEEQLAENKKQKHEVSLAVPEGSVLDETSDFVHDNRFALLSNATVIEEDNGVGDNGHDNEDKEVINDYRKKLRTSFKRPAKLVKEISWTPTRSKAAKGKHIKCQFCSATFSSLRDKDRHERIHTGEKPFKCQHCDAKFARSETKNAHERTHNTDKPVVAQRIHKTEPPQPVPDDPTTSRLRPRTKAKITDKHLKSQSQCCISPSKTPRPSINIKRRPERVHVDRKPHLAHACEYCSKHFRRNSDLEDHIRTHTGEKPYVCPRQQCKQTFSSSNNLRKHVRGNHR